MYIMVYGKYGRTGIYQMQELMRRVNTNITDYPTKISNFKKIYEQLPELPRNSTQFHTFPHIPQ